MPGTTVGISTWTGIDPAASAFGSSATPVGDVNGDGINDFTIGAFQDCAVYLYFGVEDDQTELASYDIVIEGPGFGAAGGCPDASFSNVTEISLARTAPGNFADVDEGPATAAYDDIFLQVFNFSTFGGDSHVVLGRSQQDWDALSGRLSVVGPGDVPDPDTVNCASSVITFYGQNPPDNPQNEVPLPVSRIGFSAGFSDLDGDGFEDLILGTDYVANIEGSAKPPDRGNAGTVHLLRRRRRGRQLWSRRTRPVDDHGRDSRWSVRGEPGRRIVQS